MQEYLDSASKLRLVSVRHRKHGKRILPYESPDHPDACIEPECFVGSHDRDVFGKSLRNDLAVKRIGMMKRQCKEPVRALGKVAPACTRPR